MKRKHLILSYYPSTLLTAGACVEAKASFLEVVAIPERRGIPWAVVFGHFDYRKMTESLLELARQMLRFAGGTDKHTAYLLLLIGRFETCWQIAKIFSAVELTDCHDRIG